LVGYIRAFTVSDEAIFDDIKGITEAGKDFNKMGWLAGDAAARLLVRF